MLLSRAVLPTISRGLPVSEFFGDQEQIRVNRIVAAKGAQRFFAANFGSKPEAVVVLTRAGGDARAVAAQKKGGTSAAF